MKDKRLKIAGLIKESIVDGPGIRMVVFAQGCVHNCEGCHNPHTHSFEGGKEVTVGEIIDIAKKNPLLDGITLSGGEPFEQAESFAGLAHEAKKAGLNVFTYTGYTFEHLTEQLEKKHGWKELLSRSDFIVDGRFDKQKKNMLLKFRGSENQRIIDVPRSIRENKAIIADI